MTHSKKEELSPLSAEEERVLSNTLRRVFLTAFSNPDRQGCPEHGILRTLVFRSRGLSQEERARLFDQVAHCSPCYKESLSYRKEYVKKKRIKQSVVILLALGLSTWFYFTMASWIGSRQPSIVKTPETISPHPPAPSNIGSPVQTALLDIRSQSVLRGTKPQSVTNRLTLPKGRLHLTIYLWIGSESGPYDVQLLRQSGDILARATGKGVIKKAIGTVLEVDLDTSRLSRGKHLIQIRQPEWRWRRFEVMIE